MIVYLFSAGKYGMALKLKHIGLAASIYGPLSVRIDWESKNVQILRFRRACFSIASAALSIGLIISVICLNSRINSVRPFDRMYFYVWFTFFLSTCGSLPAWWYLQSDDVTKLWSALIKIDQDSGELKLKFKLRKLRTVLPKLLPFCTIAFVAIVFLIAEYKKDAYHWAIFVIVVFTSVCAYYVQCLGIVQFSLLLTVFSDYFEQLQESLRIVFRLKGERRVVLLKQLAGAHQHFYELSRLTTTVFGFPILIIIAEAITTISKTCFALTEAARTMANEKLYISFAFGIVILSLWMMGLWSVLSPSEMCMGSVSPGKFV